jgi:hypothetical protein
VRSLIASLVTLGIAGLAAPASAQTEWDLKKAFEGKFIVVKMDMPATQYGIDLTPGREPAIDYKAYSQRVKEYGIALRAGDRVMVTTIRVKKKNIEFQLGGGGYGTFGDDSGYVSTSTESKSQREKDLERWIKDERDPYKRSRMQRELDDLRRDRERENRRREADAADLTVRKQSDIAQKRLDAGSRFNLWFDEFQLASRPPTPAELRRMLAEYVDFGEGPPPRLESRSQPMAPPPPPPRGDIARVTELRRGMSMIEVHDMLGMPARSKSGKQGELATVIESYEDAERVTEITYVGNVIVKFSTSSK